MESKIKEIIKTIDRRNIWYEEFDDAKGGIYKCKIHNRKDYLTWIVERCLAENFSIQEYELVEIPYSNEEFLIMAFWNKKKTGKCIDFVVYYQGFVVPESCINGHCKEHNIIEKAVYTNQFDKMEVNINIKIKDAIINATTNEFLEKLFVFDRSNFIKNNYGHLNLIVERCLTENFPIEKYCLLEIPYRNEEYLIMNFRHKNIKGRQVDFIVYPDKYVIPICTRKGYYYEQNTVWNAVYH